LFAKLESFMAFAQSFQLFGGLFVDGSFVTDKAAPGDIDRVLEISTPNFAQLLGHPQVLAIVDCAAVKQRYEISHVLSAAAPGSTGR
jgi:hypothetical protein